MKTFKEFLDDFNEYGEVQEIYHPVIVVSGLPSAKPREIVMLESGILGEVLQLTENTVEVLLFSNERVQVGMQVARTGQHMSLALGNYMLGQVIDPLGNFMLPLEGNFVPETVRAIDTTPASIGSRTQIRHPYLTGVSLVDTLLPLGKGQRELIVGDRKTGKTSFILTAIKSHIMRQGVVVYALIGKRATEVEFLQQYFIDQGLLSRMVLVTTTSHDSAGLILKAPFAAMCISEYLRDKGEDVLLILDDMSTHARFYREIALLAKRFPGKDSYPGDIFYLHARLLERAGNFKHKDLGEIAITCLPVAETTDGDLTDYIVSNLIGITDGHLLFDSGSFIKGRRPAINSALSVTRVGKQTQTVLHQELNQEILKFLTLYHRSENYAHFGAELSQEVKGVLNRGQQIYSFYNQLPHDVVPFEIQLVFIAMIWLDLLNDLYDADIKKYRQNLTLQYQHSSQAQALINNVVAAESFDKLLQKVNAIKSQLLLLCKVNQN